MASLLFSQIIGQESQPLLVVFSCENVTTSARKYMSTTNMHVCQVGRQAGRGTCMFDHVCMSICMNARAPTHRHPHMHPHTHTRKFVEVRRCVSLGHLSKHSNLRLQKTSAQQLEFGELVNLDCLASFRKPRDG